jgi:hypothetical protein
MARGQSANGEAKAELTAEQVFDVAAKNVAARARDLNKSVRDWKDGGEIEDLILEIQLGQRKLQKALNAMSAAYQQIPK